MYISQRYRNSRRYSTPKSSASASDKKLVTATFASPVHPTSVNDDMTGYNRNTRVMLQLHERKSDSDYSHMIKLMSMTHKIRRSKIDNSTSSAVTIKEEYPFFGHEKWVCNIHYSIGGGTRAKFYDLLCSMRTNGFPCKGLLIDSILSSYSNRTFTLCQYSNRTVLA